jgi:hypothetical protein
MLIFTSTHIEMLAAVLCAGNRSLLLQLAYNLGAAHFAAGRCEMALAAVMHCLTLLHTCRTATAPTSSFEQVLTRVI